MSWNFDGVDRYVDFALSANNQASDAGPFWFAVVVKLSSAADGALVHFLDSGNGSHQFLEVFSTFNYGTGGTAKTGPVAGTGSWKIVIVTKGNGGAAVPEYTVMDVGGGGAVSGTMTSGGLADGTAPGAGGKARVGRFGTSGTEYVAGDIGAVASGLALLSQAQREAMVDWAAWLAATGGEWAVQFQALTARVDAKGNGGDETARFGTSPITLTADPPGFFASGTDTVVADPASVGIQAGGSPAVTVADVVVYAGPGSAQVGGTPDAAAFESVASAGSGVQLGGSSASAVADGVVAAPAGSVQTGGSPAVAAADVVVTDGPGSVQAGEGPAVASSVTLAADPVPTGVKAGGSPASAVADVVAAPGGSGVQLGGSAAVAVGDVLASVLASVGIQVGGSPAVAVSDSPPVDVVVEAPLSPGVTIGGSPATASTDEVVHDLMVMPVLEKALTCLRTELLKVASPPTHYQIRPGATFTAFADNESDECCAGIGWIRPGPMYETDDFPEVRGVSKFPAGYWAVQVELGVMRCMDTVAEGFGDKIVTYEQWLAMTMRAMDDAAALRRAICCLRNQYGQDSVIAGQIAPLENDANCGGQTVVLTLRVPACDCVE